MAHVDIAQRASKAECGCKDVPPHILHVFPSFSVGGVQLRIASVIKGLGDRFRHSILALDSEYGADAFINGAQHCTLLKDVHPKPGLGGHRSRLQILKSLNADLICTYNWGAMDWALTAALSGTRHIHFESGFGPGEAVKPMFRRSLMRRMVLRRTASLVVPSQNLIKISKKARWIRKDRLRFIPNGVDVTHFTMTDRSDRTAPPVVLSVSPLREEKRIDRLLDISAPLLYSGVIGRLVIVGEGPCRRALDAQTRSLGIHEKVRFTGHLADIRPELARADIFAMTSETEQMPNALLQAMASGLPVIALDAGDVQRMVPPAQCAYIFQQDEPKAFEKGLLDLCQDRQKSVQLGAECREHVKRHYSFDAMLSAYDDLYRDVLRA